MITSSSASPLFYEVPFRCTNASPDKLSAGLQESLWQAMREKTGALVLGPTGVGKTFAMMAARKVIDSERGDLKPESLFVDWQDFVADVEAWDQFETPDKHRFDPIGRLGSWRAPVFIDDVGQEPTFNKYQKPTAPFFAAVIHQREKLPFPLWITSNLSEAEIRARYGEPPLSRIYVHCLVLELSGVDRRIAS